ncbi:MAG TPA: CpXC domain-containing protein [Kofleriaceae bacterium]|nr:CpXC domain-containing protein [Kofleriaceae bacterium]
MSHLCGETIACPACGAAAELTLFRSLNGERVPAQVELLLDGTFEQHTCAACGHRFQPEHRMLYAHVPARVWVVMCPRVDRPRFAVLEHGVALLFAESAAGAPEVVSGMVAGARPRLVFGQHMLRESLRTVQAGIDPALLECAKLLAYRRRMPELVRHGPAELCCEGVEAGELRLAIHTLGDGRRAGELRAPEGLLDEAAAARDELAGRYPDLFSRPYVSATRYLFGAAA